MTNTFIIFIVVILLILYIVDFKQNLEKFKTELIYNQKYLNWIVQAPSDLLE